MKTQAAAMECLALCMQQSYMCILVGPSGSGTHQDFLIKEVAMSPVYLNPLPRGRGHYTLLMYQ